LSVYAPIFYKVRPKDGGDGKPKPIPIPEELPEARVRDEPSQNPPKLPSLMDVEVNALYEKPLTIEDFPGWVPPEESAHQTQDVREPQPRPGFPETGLPMCRFQGNLVVFNDMPLTGVLPSPDEAPDSVMTDVDTYVGNQFETAYEIAKLRMMGYEVRVIPLQVGLQGGSEYIILNMVSPSPTKFRIDPKTGSRFSVYSIMVEPPPQIDLETGIFLPKELEPTLTSGNGNAKGNDYDSLKPSVDPEKEYPYWRIPG
jgi:hypothetical protein